MQHPQPGIFDESSRAFYYLEYRLPSSLSTIDLKQALNEILTQSLTDEYADAGCYVTFAFSRNAFTHLSSKAIPHDLRDFHTLTSPNGHTAVSTQADLFFWLHGSAEDLLFDMALFINKKLNNLADIFLDLKGFSYHKNRDLIGFVDGTGNPKDDGKYLAALIPEGQDNAAGTYLLTQKWVHKLSEFEALPVAKQEKVIGRTKVEDVELQGEAMPIDSHVSRTDIERDGVPMKIYRRSGPFGNTQENGLYFLSMACELKRISSQLDSMFGLSEDGICDQLLDYSKAKTSSYWFAPSIEELQALLK